MQLPPTLPNALSEETPGLEYTLFERATAMNLKPVMLRTQYRCHSDIARIVNALFYSGVLQNGFNQDPPPSIPCPAVCFVDVKDGKVPLL